MIPKSFRKILYAAFISLLCLSLLGVDKQAHAQSPLPSDIAITAIAWSPDGERLALGYQGGRVEIWDADTMQITHTLNGHTEGIVTLAWKPDASQLISGSYDAVPRVWDSTTGVLLAELGGISSSGTLGVTWSLDSSQIITWNFDASYSFVSWDAVSYQLVVSDYRGGDAYKIVWSPDQSKVALANIAGHLIIADPITFEPLTRFSEPRIDGGIAGIYAVVWSPDGRRVVGGTALGLVRVWELATEQNLFSVQADAAQDYRFKTVLSLRYSEDGKLIYTITGDGLLRTWDATDGTLLATQYLESPLHAAVWSPDGTKIAYGGETGSLSIIPSPQFAATCDINIAAGDTASLIQSIQNANSSGIDTSICLAPNSTYAFDTGITESQSRPMNALPPITGTITLEGNGASITRQTGAGIPQFRLFRVEDEARLTLNNLHLSNGNTPSAGGAIYNDGVVVLSGVELSSNYADNGGGAIYNAGTLITVQSIFTANSTFYNESGSIQNKGYGGAIYNAGVISASRSEFSHNQASFGGAFYNRGQLSLTTSHLDANQSGEGAGAIYNDTATASLSIIESQLTDNQSRRGMGGALVNVGATVSVTNSSFSGNQSHSQLSLPTNGDGGGTIAHYVGADRTGSLKVWYTLFTDNHSMMSNGGAVWLDGGATVEYSCFSGNSDIAVYSSGRYGDFGISWWGTADGPSGAGPGSGDSVNEPIDYIPARDTCLAG